MSTDMAGRTGDEWLELVLDAERHGEVLTANDRAEHGLVDHPDDRRLQYHRVLALARAGSTEEARTRYERYRLADNDDEDGPALGARIAKDLALAEPDGLERQGLALEAADLYAAVHARTGGHYPLVNAATLNLVGGRPDVARELAARLLSLLGGRVGESFWPAASAAEAHLVLADVSSARAALARAAELAADDFGAVSSTRRQLTLICRLLHLDPEVVSGLRVPAVVHFCGHLIAAPDTSGRFRAEDESLVIDAIERAVAASGARFAYGSLACGGDILWAEALSAAGADLHVVLPFALPAFLEHSVATGGPRWVERFHRCLDLAVSVDYATDGAYLHDDVLFRYGTDLSMGSAVLRAGHLDAPVRQLALWDGRPADNPAGTAAAVQAWRRRGLPTTVVGTPASSTAAIRGAGSARAGRVVRAMLFADVRGFTALTDEQLPLFTQEVLGRFAEVLQRHSGSVQHQNTWGDAVYAVLDDVVAAAECATELEQVMDGATLAQTGLPGHLALRVSAHVGPVFEVRDPVIGRTSFMGAHVSRTARIEPVTPPGIVYVTEHFAAALAMRVDHPFRCDYVGHMPTAKNYGRLRMYRLRRSR